MGSFEVFFNNKCLFSKLRTKNWPVTGQIVELVEKEINRVQNCIPEENLISNFAKKRSIKNTEELSTRPQSSNDQHLKKQERKPSLNSLMNSSKNKKNVSRSPEKSIQEKSIDKSNSNSPTKPSAIINSTHSVNIKQEDSLIVREDLTDSKLSPQELLNQQIEYDKYKNSKYEEEYEDDFNKATNEFN